MGLRGVPSQGVSNTLAMPAMGTGSVNGVCYTCYLLIIWIMDSLDPGFPFELLLIQLTLETFMD